MGDKKLYLYSGLAIVTAVIAYLVITKKKPLDNTSSEGTGVPDESGTVATTTTGEIVDQSQVIIPATLVDVLKKTTPQANAILINKPVYTKLDNVKVRNENYVNNGFITNIMSTITNRGTLLGTVIQIKDDKGKLVNADGRVYKWFRIKPSQIALDDMTRNTCLVCPKFPPEYIKEIYVREDTIKMEK